MSRDDYDRPAAPPSPGGPTQLLSDLLRRVTSGQETVFEVAGSMGGHSDEGVKLSVGQRQLQPELPLEKPLARSPRRAHTFHTAEAVAAYLVQYGGPHTVMLADATERRAKIIINELAPQGFERLDFIPPLDPRLVPWAALMGKTVPLDGFTSFVISRRADVRGIINAEGDEYGTGRELALLLRQIKISRSSTLYTGLGARSVNGVVVNFRATAGGPDEQQTVELPDGIMLEVPIFVATPAIPIRLDLTLDGRDDKVQVLITAPDFERAVLDLFTQLLDRIRDLMAAAKPDFSIYQELGSIDHADWDVVK